MSQTRIIIDFVVFFINAKNNIDLNIYKYVDIKLTKLLEVLHWNIRRQYTTSLIKCIAIAIYATQAMQFYS